MLIPVPSSSLEVLPGPWNNRDFWILLDLCVRRDGWKLLLLPSFPSSLSSFLLLVSPFLAPPLLLPHPFLTSSFQRISFPPSSFPPSVIPPLLLSSSPIISLLPPPVFSFIDHFSSFHVLLLPSFLHPFLTSCLLSLLLSYVALPSFFLTSFSSSLLSSPSFPLTSLLSYPPFPLLSSPSSPPSIPPFLSSSPPFPSSLFLSSLALLSFFPHLLHPLPSPLSLLLPSFPSLLPSFFAPPSFFPDLLLLFLSTPSAIITTPPLFTCSRPPFLPSSFPPSAPSIPPPPGNHRTNHSLITDFKAAT